MSDRTDPMSAAARLLRQGAPVDVFIRMLDDGTRTRFAGALGIRVYCHNGLLCSGHDEGCEAVGRRGLGCTRSPGHEGPHIACGETMHDLAVWWEGE